MSRDLGSAPLPPLGPEDHVRGATEADEGLEDEAGEGNHWGALPFSLVVYADYTCPHCALLYERLQGRGLTVVHRHFALRSRARAFELACAAEAAGAQGEFWTMHDSLLADRSHQDDPHLWARAVALGLDLERFERDRRSQEIADRVRRDVDGGLRGGVCTTPTLVVDGRVHPGPLAREAIDALLGARAV